MEDERDGGAVITSLFMFYINCTEGKEQRHTHTHTHTPSFNTCSLLTSSSPLWSPGWYITECTWPCKHVCICVCVCVCVCVRVCVLSQYTTGHEGVLNTGWAEACVNILSIDFSSGSLPSCLFSRHRIYLPPILSSSSLCTQRRAQKHAPSSTLSPICGRVGSAAHDFIR